MATFTLTGRGTESISTNTKHLLVTVNVFSAGISSGSANPTDYYHVGAIRFGWIGFFYAPIWIDAEQMVLDVPVNADTFGYSLFDQTQVTVVERQN